MKPVPQLRLPPGGSFRIVEQHDEAGQVLALAPQAVQRPGAEAGPAAENAAGVHLADAADVVQPSAWQLRITAMSSTHVAISGYQSLTQMPDWPCCLNLRCEASSGV